jgi:outer membrane protein
MNPFLNLKYAFKSISLLLCTSGFALAQSPTDTLRINLEDAIAIALKNSMEIQLAKNDVEAKTLLNHYGVAGGYPTVAATATNTEQINNIKQDLSNGTSIERSGAAGNNTQIGVSAGIILYNGNRIVSTKKRLGELQSQSSEYLNAEIQNTIALVMTSYYDVIRQQSYINTINKSIEASQQRLDILEVRKEAGMANNSDLFQAQIDVNTLQQNLMNQNLVVDVAKAELLKVLTLNPQTPLAIRDTILIDNQIQLDEILSRVSAHPIVKSAEHQIRINELIVRETAALRYPTVRLNTAYNYGRNQSAAGFTLLNQTSGPNASLSVAIPIYSGGALKRQQQAAQINTSNAILQKDLIVRDYQTNIAKMFQTYSVSLQQLEAQKKNYTLSQQLLNLTMQRFQLIQATIIDVREAQRSFEEAGYRLINLNYAAKSAEIELKRMASALQ